MEQRMGAKMVMLCDAGALLLRGLGGACGTRHSRCKRVNVLCMHPDIAMQCKQMQRN